MGNIILVHLHLVMVFFLNFQNRIAMISDLLKPEYTFLWVAKQLQNFDKISELPLGSSSQSPVINDEQREFISKLIKSLSNLSQHRMQCQASLSSSSSSPSSSHCTENFETVESFSGFLKDICESTPNIKYGQIMKLTRQALRGPKVSSHIIL